MQIILKDLPKISLNKWYAGSHWTKRKEIKDIYTTLIKSQYNNILTKDSIYNVDYIFKFKKSPLDSSNCVAMLKMIEDIIFEDDNYNIIPKISISSEKSNEDLVIINVYELGKYKA